MREILFVRDEGCRRVAARVCSPARFVVVSEQSREGPSIKSGGLGRQDCNIPGGDDGEKRRVDEKGLVEDVGTINGWGSATRALLGAPHAKPSRGPRVHRACLMLLEVAASPVAAP
ncbi:hypothetical protein K461DRAFT_157811 [Myriangium duriaei CBS 260.36]|uniref:Uncharacterized protein n=1 Tax=Myriangium duriaei CBS 260.36 TaxID=1168546 RepID=A0A9P4MF08_9PEZI|nr:hypothetical protein K461DRAFT_157811 [Myriangium duriaei CBS 260.36]